MLDQRFIIRCHAVIAQTYTIMHFGYLVIFLVNIYPHINGFTYKIIMFLPLIVVSDAAEVCCFIILIFYD